MVLELTILGIAITIGFLISYDQAEEEVDNERKKQNVSREQERERTHLDQLDAIESKENEIWNQLRIGESNPELGIDRLHLEAELDRLHAERLKIKAKDL